MAGVCKRVVVGHPHPRFSTNFCIDGHSHIQSGATAPLPLLWNQLSLVNVIKPRRRIIDSMATFLDVFAPFIMDGGKIQRLSTVDIGKCLIDELLLAYDEKCILRKDEPYKSCEKVFSPVIIMPMDMDYAHIAGFPPVSSTIYHEGIFTKRIIRKEGVFYYEREDAHAPEYAGKLRDISHERPNMVWLYRNYKRQYQATVEAVKYNPWQLIPMFHYEPRRWRMPVGTVLEKDNWVFGAWDFPFSMVCTPQRAGIFVGFKMYTPLGYRPLDHRLPHLDDFYRKCEEEQIPIMAHCSSGGITTHEIEFYHKLEGIDLSNPPEHLTNCNYDLTDPKGWFYHHYVHPRNWRKVLIKYPRLKLCLAHMGGDELKHFGDSSDWVKEIFDLCDPQKVQGHDKHGNEIRFENVYTDMSCYDLESRDLLNNVKAVFAKMCREKSCAHMRDKVIFGVDWYLSLVTGAPKYKQYSESFFKTMKQIDPWQWYRSALLNPAKFYGLDQEKIIDNMNRALEESLADKEKRLAGYESMVKVKEQAEKVRRELEKVR